ncbi:MAG: hypothetical protein ACRD3I_15325, partial [Terriglobales bacterium]
MFWAAGLTFLLTSHGAIGAGVDPGLARLGFQASQSTPAVEPNETRLPNAAELGRIDTLLQQAADYRARGEVAEGFKALEEARALTERSQDKGRQALVLCGLSDGYLLGRRLEDARRYAEEGVTAARQAANPSILATALNHLGNALMASQRYPEALRTYAEGSSLAERSADPELTVTLLINAIHAHLANGSAQEAIPILETALTKTRTLSASRAKTFGLLALGHLAQRLAISTPAHRGRLIQSAYHAFTEARALAEGLA